ncbi:unnamed protein product [Thelazia callipaeda]|uniref:BHLH domain-containing protein n=1 Tax=Thelazia callipaeda TaxID=103827 RepID=A0A0N5DC27_THECL|nr:unnamed protein product [Thelazia callipaeda]
MQPLGCEKQTLAQKIRLEFDTEAATLSSTLESDASMNSSNSSLSHSSSSLAISTSSECSFNNRTCEFLHHSAVKRKKSYKRRELEKVLCKLRQLLPSKLMHSNELELIYHVTDYILALQV